MGHFNHTTIARNSDLAEAYERAGLDGYDLRGLGHYDNPDVPPKNFVVVPMEKGHAREVARQVLARHCIGYDLEETRHVIRAIREKSDDILIAYRAPLVEGAGSVRYDLDAEPEIVGFAINQNNTVTIFQPLGLESAEVSEALIAASARLSLAHADYEDRRSFVVSVLNSDPVTIDALNNLGGRFKGSETDPVLGSPAQSFYLGDLVKKFTRPWTRPLAL